MGGSLGERVAHSGGLYLTEASSARPAIDLALEGAKSYYDFEERKKAAFENKAGAILATSGLILTVMGAFPGGLYVTYGIVVSLVVAMASSVLVLLLRRHRTPFARDPAALYDLAEEEPPALKDRWLTTYVTAIERNRKINKERLCALLVAFLALTVALAMLVVGLLVSITSHVPGS